MQSNQKVNRAPNSPMKAFAVELLVGFSKPAAFPKLASLMTYEKLLP
jgi:hypothetical protein